jgi:NAD(P)-dependent dehydrogenase (short-subunit alcohol dehydrogenase family)
MRASVLRITEMGAHYKHGIRAFVCRFAIQGRHYVSAKHGVARLTKIAVELATLGITCNCISPAYVWTPLVEKQIPHTPRKPAV